MTIEELIRELEGLPQDTEVRFASQPSWPFEYSISSVVFIEEEIDNDGSDGEDNDDRQGVLYLVEGGQIGYLPGNVKDEIGW